MTDKLLEIDVGLLLVRYGRTKVLQALASSSEQTVESLGQQLLAIKQAPKAKQLKSSAIDFVTSEFQEHPGILESLRILAVGFENRSFLPHLRDVQRFLDRIGSARKLKSRAVAVPFLFRALAKLEPEQLARLAAADKSEGDSDYSLLARAIMGPSTIKRHHPK